MAGAESYQKVIICEEYGHSCVAQMTGSPREQKKMKPE